MLLHPKQDQVANDLHRFRVLNCGRRWGKSTLAIEEIKGVAIAKPTKCAYIATTYAQARDIAWEMIKRDFGRAIIQANESRLELRIKTQDNEVSIVFLRGWESVETLRGMQFDFIVLDEVASMRNFWTGWQEVLRPTLTDTKGEALFISTPNGYNHWYDLGNLELKDTDYKTFHFTTYDNPHIPVEEIEKAKKELSQEQFLQEYMASFQKTSGLVYKEFSREKHLYDELPQGTWSKIAGIDFGYRNPAAVLHIFTNGEMYFVEDEWYKRERTEAVLADYVATCNFEAVYPDPESANGIEELRKRNMNVREVSKGKDSIESGIQKVRELLINSRLKVNKQCVNLISEFEMYSHDEDNLNENPIKEHDHALDALRYALFMRDFKPEISREIKHQFDIKRERIARDSTK